MSFFFHEPRRNSQSDARVMAVSAAGMAVKTPLACHPSGMARAQANGIWKHQ